MGLGSGAVRGVAAQNDPVVKTEKVSVRVIINNKVDKFLGIPYAAPPTGNLRWRPPEPAAAWTGVLSTSKFANACAQVTTIGPFAGPTSITEDCLYLNVFTTGTTGPKKPVIVWIHGGGNFAGASDAYDGSKLATGGPDGVATVVVTMNYRLDLIGYLSHPALNTEGHLHSNYGILDIQAALKWVQRNIAAFGGDPDRVLLSGESGGAVDTGANLVSPFAKGLFHRAMFQSSPGVNAVDRSVALSKGIAFAEAAGCPGSGGAAAACLRRLSVERILQLSGTPAANGPYSTAPLGLIADGTIVPVIGTEALSTRRWNKMPIAGGTTRDELTFTIAVREYFTAKFGASTKVGAEYSPITPHEYEALVRQGYGSRADAVLSRYPVSSYENDPQLAYTRVISDPIACGALGNIRQFAKEAPTYWYQFRYRNAPFYFPKMPGFRALAAHTIDIQFIFPNFHGGHLGVNVDQSTGMPRGFDRPETKLSDQMVAEWTNFAATGNPNGSGNSPWPRFTATSEVALAQDIPLAVLTADDIMKDSQCGFWAPQL
jgi:para-nitrobenzyl esterase